MSKVEGHGLQFEIFLTKTVGNFISKLTEGPGDVDRVVPKRVTSWLERYASAERTEHTCCSGRCQEG